MTRWNDIALMTAVAVLAFGLSSTLAPGRAQGSDDGPRLDSVQVDLVDLPWQDEDGGTDTLDRRVVLRGHGFYGTAFGPDVLFELPDGRRLESTFTVLQDAATLVAHPPGGTRGPVRILVRNPDGRSVARRATL